MHSIFIYFVVPIELSASTFCLCTKVRVQHKLGWTLMPMAAASLRDTVWWFFSRSVMSNSLRPRGLQHTRLPHPSPSLGVYSNSSPFSWWCHPTISSSDVPFSSYLQSFQHQRLFKRVALCIRWPKYWSLSFSISPSNEYSGLLSFRMDWFDLLAV